MEYITILLAALVGSGLTLYSGFGLGTLMVPVFGLFFPIDVAVVMTAIVHFLNNLFKLGLVGRYAHWPVALSFGLPAIATAFLGAFLLSVLGKADPLLSYSVDQYTFVIDPLKLTMAVLLVVFALFDMVPQLANLQFDGKFIPLGGMLSGFFGGLSGHQGALRSAFLLRAGLSKEAYIGTGVVIACMVDVSRLGVYATMLSDPTQTLPVSLMVLATLAAFAGAYLGNKFLKKLTLEKVHKAVAVFLIVFAVLLGCGIV